MVGDMNTYEGKLIMGRTNDEAELMWIVSDNHAPNLQPIAKLFRHYNNHRVRIRIEEVENDD